MSGHVANVANKEFGSMGWLDARALKAALRRSSAAVLAALAFVALVSFTAPVQAQTDTLVSNFASRGSSSVPVGDDIGDGQVTVQAQRFVTGPSAVGYTLSSVKFFADIDFSGNNVTVKVSIYSADADGNPDSELFVLTGTATTRGEHTFNAPANSLLADSTSYFVYFEDTNLGTEHLGVRLRYGVRKADDGKTAEGLPGWAIEDRYQKVDTGSWEASSDDIVAIELIGAVANTAPEFPDSTLTREVAENTMADVNVGDVIPAATDADMDDLEYSMEGDDAASFNFNVTTRQISTKEALDYEDQDSYSVTIKVDDSNGGTDTVAVTINVTDVDEPPDAPPAPSVEATSGSTTSLDVDWTAPDNDGKPEIVDYDLRYRVAGTEGWTAGPQNVETTSAVIAGLTASTDYQVQVSARNAEGDGDFSASGAGSTSTPGNNPPDFSDTTLTREIAENTGADVNIGDVIPEATDADIGATLVYSMEGDDAASFNFNVTTRQISTKSGVTYNFEATKNSYSVTIKADDGNGGTDTVDVTISLTDVDEPPDTPAAPSVSSASLTSVTATWAAPSNAGPAITDYDYRHRVKSPQGSWTEVADTTSTALSATITGLAEDTEYEVQVRAASDEGTSGWSASGSGSTDANAAPSFTSSATFNAAENQTAVGTVAATDGDSGDSVTGYEIHGGADRSSFSIVDSTGVLTFASAPNFEASADADGDNDYVVVVRATSGTGAREKTADQTVTVTVTDVDEPPDTPAAPTVTATPGSATSLDVEWTAPDNAGKPAVSYFLQYRVGDSGNFRGAPDPTGTSATITGLIANTDYEVQVMAENEEGKSDWSESGIGRTGNNAPVFADSTLTRSIAENTPANTNIGDVIPAATDADMDDLEYSMEGDDAASFNFNVTTRQISTKSGVTYNFEATKNSYSVTIKADDGNGGTDTVDVTISLTDVDEPPDTPAAPSVSSASLTSVTATWAAPSNAGPAITDYDYRHRVKSPQGSWTEVADTTSTALSATITGLAEDTEYEVQVRAASDEGTSGWSASGSGSTDANAAPSFTSSATFNAAENQTAVGTVAATDGDSGDSVTGYAIEGGADRSSFSIVAATGVLTFASAPNFEAPADADGDNDYVVVVRATSGTGARESMADQTITVTVTDVAGEAPGVPAAPSVSASSATSVTATWTAPSNAGPAITDYDYRHRVKSPQGSWTEVADTTSTALSATITGLAEDTEYDVQVRATSDEGTSGWSASGSGSTDANAAPSFTSSATFDAAENQTAVGTVAATDGDSGDSVTGYAIEGGADWPKFSIAASTGVLTFASAPNFEGAADDDGDNDYVVVVRATSGTGARVKTADQTITVTVTDEVERPDKLAVPTVVATPGSHTSLNVSWTAPNNDGRPRITGYNVQWRQRYMGVTWTDGPQGVTGTSTTISGLRADREYRVRVRADNHERPGPWSSPAAFVSTNNPPVHVPTTTEVPAGWSLTPDGLSAGDRFRLLFVTGERYPLLTRGLDFIGATVRDEAAGGHSNIQRHASSFTPLACSYNGNAIVNAGTPTSDASVSVHWLGGEKVADNYADLYDGSWDSNEPRFPDGTTAPRSGDGGRVVNGCQSSGRSHDDHYVGADRIMAGQPGSSGSEIEDAHFGLVSSTFRMYGLSGIFTVGTNTSPTASDASVTTNEDTPYTFAAANFNFADTDTGDMLTSVKLVTLPTAGALALDDSRVSANDVVPVADLGDLVYTPAANANGTDYASFTFKVSDGTHESASAYTMTVNVTAVNDPATGAPTISGTAQVDETLTASTSGIEDVDGLTGVSYTYQWIRVDADSTSNATDIASATSVTYTPVAADGNKKLKVKVSFTDNEGNDEERTSDAWPSSGTIIDPDLGICGRTPVVRDALLGRIDGVTDCALVTDTHLGAIGDTLGLKNMGITSLAAGDFAGLTALGHLHLFKNEFTTLPAGVFEGLTALEVLDLHESGLTTLPAGVFEGLTALEVLSLYGNKLSTLPDGIFEPLTSLTALLLVGNPGVSSFVPEAVALPDDGTVPATGGYVTLEGSASGLWGTNVTYSWALPSSTFGATVRFPDNDSTSVSPRVRIISPTAGTALTFTLTVSGRGSEGGRRPNDTDTATVTVNAAPTSADKTVTLAEDGTHTFSAADFNFSDTDSGDSLALVEVVTLPSDGALTLDGDTATVNLDVPVADIGDLVFTPAADGNGDPYTTFTFKVSDGTDKSALAYTLTLDVTAVADAPVVAVALADQTATVGRAFTYVVPADAFTDADGDTLIYSAARSDDSALPSWLTFTAATRTFTGTPAAGDTSTVTLKVTVKDGADASARSVSDEFSLAVTVNAAPTSADKTVTLAEDGTHTFSAADFNFSDTDSGDSLALVEVVTLPSDGALTLDGDTATVNLDVPVADIGDLVFTPAADGNGDPYTTFTFKVSDGTDKSALAYTLTLDVTAVADAPVVAVALADQTATVGRAFTYVVPADAFTDADGDTLIYSAARSDDSALPSWLTFTAATRTFTGTPAAGDTSTVTLKVTVKDGADASARSVSDEFSLAVTVNAAPSFTSSATFDAAENQTAVGTVAATDGDSGDSVTGYAIHGGADRSSFSIVDSTGVLTFASAPNFEGAADADGDGDYVVVVRATSGTGAREKTADQTITVTVTDVAGEAPGVPAAPSVSASSVTSVTATWTAPSNAGPAITDYDYRHRVKSPQGSWTAVTTTTITALSATIAGLAEDTEYEVQVRATSDEGTSGWSASGSGSTDANAAPSFTSSATFDAAENQTAVGTVAATDGDSGDSVTGYAIHGGADRSKFSIVDSTGVLTFASAPNFEGAADADGDGDYVVVVRATSGTGAREKTADQTITVTVTDVAGEAPGVPAAPSVSASSVTSVTATWTAPSNAGPAITDYDYRHRVKSPQGSWTAVTTTTITALSATIAGLAEDTEYEVQVRATSDEGTSGWSASGSGSTDANAAPSFTSSATFDAAENQTAVGTVAATDGDSGDSVTGYAIHGGADRSSFSIVDSTGVLTFASAPNFEGAADADGDGDYVVVVRATSGTGAREKTADQTITVTVTDVAGEAPGVPAAPSVSASSVTSVTATWTAPSNAGPAITDYDYRHRVKSPQGSWTAVTTTTITALSATIAGLAEDTEYEVQVRATSDEGTSGWSASGSGSTDANAAPSFTSSATFDAAENQTAVGTVAATDGDSGDSVTGYAIHGGADRSKFSIVDSTGVLTFASAPNFEGAADADGDNDYVVVVRATSGTGAREKTADQTITVTVTDVAGEAPGVPAAPSVSASSVTSVTATWTAPSNAGPAITDYDYRHRVKSPQGSWTAVTTTTITALSATIAGLAEDTEYEVQVRATSDEGTSGWSASGSGSTDANAAPSFTSSATFDAAENQTAVGTVAATDGDSGDSVTGYAIHGGADRSKFSIVDSTGVLTFASAPNFEGAADADGDGDYVVVVRATSGTGAREKTADQTITVTVTDVAGEAPGVPAAPSVSASSVTSVTATWTAPSNAGPAITDYDYRHRVKSPQGSWTAVTTTTITALSATIAGLAEDTEYEVQVRATSDEGTSGWSASGSGSTDANAAPSFTSSATFDAAENQTAVGTVAATDGDSGDSVTGYAIHGGADRSKFSIVDSTGVLTFASAPNFEGAADADGDGDYVVVVRATSGTGAREKTADQTITVTVTDVAGEAPGVPAAPSVSASSVTSVTATWTAPSNAGPAITDYDYRHRVKSPQGSWTAVTTTTITALSATIAGLAEDTEYEVQVRATSDEGTSGWSASGSGSTDANAAPSFTSSATFDAAENQTAVGTVAATDGDSGDSVTGYAIHGGADRSKFSIVDSTGVLTFASAPNFEGAADADGDGDYVVVVRATSGTGAREKTADQTITVTVTDVAGEAPGVPAAPSVSASSVTSVTATWTAPSNAGPAITDYDYRHRVKSPQGSWTAVTTTTITALSATIAGLAEDTEYEVQVRATSDEGTSGWSASGSGKTNAPDNSAPVFPDTTLTRSVAENSPADVNVGEPIPAANDVDAGDTLTYSMEGADKDSFNFDPSTRQITTRAGVDYDYETTPSYEVTVKVDDGRGGTDTVGVTINLTDVANEVILATLDGLSLSGIELNESFAADRTDYTATVPHAVDRTTVTVDLTSEGATATILPVDAESLPGHQVDLDVGATAITVRVSTLGGDEKTYRVTVTREQPRPDAPVSFGGSGDEGTVTLVWQAPDDGGSPVLRYEYRYRSVGGTWPSWTLVPGGATARRLEVRGLEGTGRYEFEVRAVNGNGPGPASVAVVGASSSYGTLTAAFEEHPEPLVHFGEAFPVTLDFSDLVRGERPEMIDRGVRVTGGTARHAEPDHFRPQHIYLEVTPSGTGDVEVTVEPQPCEMEGSICTSAGNGLAGRKKLTIRGVASVPDKPTNVRALRSEDDYAVLYWDLDEEATAYTLRWRRSGGEWREESGRPPGPNTTIHWFGATRLAPPELPAEAFGPLEPGRSYDVEIRWENPRGAGAWVDVSEVVRNIVPPQPQSLTLIQRSPSAVELSWKPHSAAGALLTAKHQVRLARHPHTLPGGIDLQSAGIRVFRDNGWVDIQDSGNNGANFSSALLSGAFRGQPLLHVWELKAQVRAVNAAGQAGPASEVAFVPDTAPGFVSVKLVSRPTRGTTYSAGETIAAELVVSEPVTVTGGTPTLTMHIGGETREAAFTRVFHPDWAYEGGWIGNSGTRMRFAYVVQAGDVGTDRIEFPAGGVRLNGARVLDATLLKAGATRKDAVLSWVSPGPETVRPVRPPPEVSVADAAATEGLDASMSFTVTLSSESLSSARVDYATADGSARADSDYTAASGTLIFPAGETSKTVTVVVLQDNDEEADETLTLTLSNASGATLADSRATGTIVNGDPPVDPNAGPPMLSISDARAKEGEDSSISFIVTLSPAAGDRVSVGYVTYGGNATEGMDYTGIGGDLYFEPGETSKTIAVVVLSDSYDEGEEYFNILLYGAESAEITDDTGKGVIVNTGPMPRALMARFGRAAAMQVVEHVEERLQAPRDPGFRGQVAGRQLRPGMEREMALDFLRQLGASAGARPVSRDVYDPMPGASASAALRTPGLATTGMAAGTDGDLNVAGLLDLGLGSDDILTGSAFTLDRETGRGGVFSVWGRGARSHFLGRAGKLSLNGGLHTTMLGADYAKGPMVAGLSLVHSRGRGGYDGLDIGEVASSVTGLYPWVGYKASKRVTVWGVTGYGKGSLSLTPEGAAALESGLSMAMAAVGTRGELIASGTVGFGLAFKADALWVGTAFDGVEGPAGNLAGTRAAVTRFRTRLEGSRGHTFSSGLSLLPSVEVGLRHDGGDAETGSGVDIAGGLVVSNPAMGLSADVRVRMLLVHQAEGFRDRGVSISFSYDPTPSTPLGFAARLAPSWGGQAESGAEALWGRDTMTGLANGSHASSGRMDAEIGYGMAVGRCLVGVPRFGLGTSETGRDYRLGYSLSVGQGSAMNFEFGLDAQRRQSLLGQGNPDHSLHGRITATW